MKNETYEKVATGGGAFAGLATLATMFPLGKYAWIATLGQALGVTVAGWAANKGVVTKAQGMPVIFLAALLLFTGVGEAAGPVNPKGAQWTAPTTNTDASPLTDLGGYNVYISPGTPTASSCPGGTWVKQLPPNSGQTATVLAASPTPSPGTIVNYQLPTNLPGAPGQKSLTVTAVDLTGVESACAPPVPFSSKQPGVPGNVGVQ